MNDEIITSKRRVYELPTELVDRIISYQKAKGLPSEVEAARRLLDEALMQRDTVETVVGRMISAAGPGNDFIEAARSVLVGHPLVKRMLFERDTVTFGFAVTDCDAQDNIATVTPFSFDNILIDWPDENQHEPYFLRYTYDGSQPVGERLKTFKEPTKSRFTKIDIDDDNPF